MDMSIFDIRFCIEPRTTESILDLVAKEDSLCVRAAGVAKHSQKRRSGKSMSGCAESASHLKLFILLDELVVHFLGTTDVLVALSFLLLSDSS